METIYTRPTSSPSGIQAVIDCLNSSEDLSFEVNTTRGMRNAFVRNFSSGNENVTAVTPDPSVALSWHRNTVDQTDSPAIISMAETVKDHYGRSVPLVTGSTIGKDGKLHAFAALPMSPRNPGGATNYRQQEELTDNFVEVCRANIGEIVHIDQNGWGCSLPVKIGRGRSSVYQQVSGLTIAQMRDTEGKVLYSADRYEFEPDPADAQRPELRKREKSRTRGMHFWPVLTDQKVSALEAAANGDSPAAEMGDDMDAFMASLTTSS